MRKNLAVSAAMAVVCLWAAVARAQVTFATAEKDIAAHWKKSYPTETVLAITSRGAGVSSVKIINLKKVPYYSVPAKVRVKRADASLANFSVSAIYAKPGARWIFEDVGVGNVEQEKAGGQEPPPMAEAEELIRKGWVDMFSQHGHTEITIHKVYPNPTFKAYEQRFWYIYKIDVDYKSANTQRQCRGQQVDLKKENAGAPWVFGARLSDPSGVCEGRNLK